MKDFLEETKKEQELLDMSMRQSIINKMERQSLEKEVEYWIKSTLSQPNEIFGGLPPCPYAQKAWTEGKVKVLEDTFTYDYDKLISGELDVILIVLRGATFKSLMDEKNNLTKNLSKRLVVLEDHPDANEEVLGYNLNFGKPCLFVQDRERLKLARDFLENTEYYKNFDKEYKDDILSN